MEEADLFKFSITEKTRKITAASLFLAMAMVLPLVTAQIPQVGKMLCPMHFPVLLCGFICGPWYGLIIGFIAPLLRFSIFGMPIIFPTGIMMCFELAAYGLCAGIFYSKSKKVFLSLTFAIIAGRLMRLAVYGGFLQSLPGTALQLAFIPPIVKRIM